MIKKLSNVFVFNVCKQIYAICLYLFTNTCNYIPYYILARGLGVVAWIIQGGRGGGPRCGGVDHPGRARWWPSVWWCGSSREGAVAYMQPTTQAGTRKAPQCGGALACESKFQGKFAGCDCSNYQLFRCSSWDGFYRLIFHLSH